MLRAALTEGMAKPDQELLRAWMLRHRAWTIDPAGVKVMYPVWSMYVWMHDTQVPSSMLQHRASTFVQIGRVLCRRLEHCWAGVRTRRERAYPLCSMALSEHTRTCVWHSCKAVACMGLLALW